MNMRVLIVLVLLVSLTSASIAQVKIEYGAKGGLNISSLGLSSSSSSVSGKLVGVSYHSRVDFHLGGYASFKLKKFALQPEIVFSRQGQNFSTAAWSNLRTKLNYINIPVVLKYYVGSVLNLQAGAQVGFLVGAKGDLLDRTNNTGRVAADYDLKGYLKSADISAVFGAALDFPFGVNLTFRYNLGLTDINKYSGSSSIPGIPSNANATPSFSTAQTQNQVIQISVGYRLGKIVK